MTEVRARKVRKLQEALHELWMQQTKAAGYQWHTWMQERAEEGDAGAKAWCDVFDRLAELEGGSAVKVKAWIPSDSCEEEAQEYDMEPDSKWQFRLSCIAEEVAQAHYEECGEHFDSTEVCLRYDGNLYEVVVETREQTIMDFDGGKPVRIAG